jgi:hypothetical protein
MTKKGVILIALIAASSNSFAQNRLSTPTLSCRTIADAVADRGAVLLSTGRDRFDRYVSDQSRCSLGEQITPAWVQSADSNECFVGYTCDQYHE